MKYSPCILFSNGENKINVTKNCSRKYYGDKSMEYNLNLYSLKILHNITPIYVMIFKEI